MRPASQLPADAATRGTLFEHARSQGLAAELTDLVHLEVRKRQRRRNQKVRGISALSLLLLFTLWAIPTYRSTDSITTRSANRQTLVLPDGSRTDLNARTRLKTDYRFGRRTVHLTQGEAFFSVSSDPSHPFLVETPAGTIRVTGTRFNVRLLPDNSAEVTLLEGSVSVLQSGGDTSLTTGRQLTFGPGADRATDLSPSELESVTAWREGRLILDGLTVSEASSRMAAYHGIKIEIDPTAASVLLGGSCPLDDMRVFIDSLKATGAVTVLPTSNGYRVFAQN